jgi:hypothetical protein
MLFSNGGSGQLTEKGTRGSLIKEEPRVLIEGTKMNKKNHHFQGKAYEAIQNNLLGLLDRLEHRIEILTALSHSQRTNGHQELAEVSKRQAMETKKHSETIRKLLVAQNSGRG